MSLDTLTRNTSEPMCEIINQAIHSQESKVAKVIPSLVLAEEAERLSYPRLYDNGEVLTEILENHSFEGKVGTTVLWVFSVKTPLVVGKFPDHEHSTGKWLNSKENLYVGETVMYQSKIIETIKSWYALNGNKATNTSTVCGLRVDTDDGPVTFIPVFFTDGKYYSINEQTGFLSLWKP